jgi:hypothetical protein
VYCVCVHGGEMHAAPVAATEHAQSLSINPRVGSDGSVNASHEILVVTAAPVLDAAACKLLTVACRTSWVEIDHAVPGTGEDMSAGRPAAAERAVRPSVYHQHWEKTPFYFEFSLCLSRACLGKIIVFAYKWLKNGVFVPVGTFVPSAGGPECGGMTQPWIAVPSKLS